MGQTQASRSRTSRFSRGAYETQRDDAVSFSGKEQGHLKVSFRIASDAYSTYLTILRSISKQEDGVG